MDFGTYTCIAKRNDGVLSSNSITFKRNKDEASGFDFHIDREFALVSPIIQPIIEEENSNEVIKENEPLEFNQKENEIDAEDSKESLVIGNINNDRSIRILEEFQTYTHEGII